MNSLGIREVADDVAHLVFRVYKPVASDDESWVYLYTAVQSVCFCQKMWVGLIAGGETLHLSIDGGVVNSCAAIDIVVTELAANHYILNVDVVTIATGTTAADDAVGVELINHSLSTERRIDLANATLLYQHVAVLEDLLQLAQLLVHCYDNSYFHTFFNFYVGKGTKKLRIEN